MSLRTVRTKTHKLTVDLLSGAGELYDLASDPNELTNLFDSSDARDIRKSLEHMLLTRSEDIGPDRVQVGMA